MISYNLIKSPQIISVTSNMSSIKYLVFSIGGHDADFASLVQSEIMIEFDYDYDYDCGYDYDYDWNDLSLRLS